MTEDIHELNGWAVLVEETRAALATLQVDELEALAARAESMFARGDHVPNLRGLAEQNSMLGELLRATDSNLSVLRQLQGRR